MNKIRRIMTLTLSLVLMLPCLGLAAGGGGAAPLVIVADTRRLDGIMAWWGNLYNDSHLYFTALTVIVIPVVGVIFGVLADIVMHFIGIDLKSRELAEH